MLKCKTRIVYRCYFACSYTDSRGKFVYLICGGGSRNHRSLNRRQTYDCVCPIEIRKFNSFDDYYARVHRDNCGIAILERVSIPFYIENNENSVVTIHEERVITIDCYLINIRSYETYKNIRNSDHFAELLYSEFDDLNLSEIFLNGYFIKINSDKIII